MKDYMIRLGKLSFEGISNIPTVEVFVEAPEGDQKLVGYMTPFRGYRIQISANKSGNMDLGASPVVAFYRDQLPVENSEIWLKGQIIMALLSFCNNRYGSEAAEGHTIRIPDYNIIDKDFEIMQDFIKESIIWIRKH